MRQILNSFFFFFLLIFSATALSYPTTEKLPATGALPIEVLSTQPSKVYSLTFGDYQNKYLFVPSSTSLKIIDLETWDTYTTQPDNFDSTVVDITVLSNGKSVIVALANGNIARFELDDLDTFINTNAPAAASLVKFQSDDTTDGSSTDNTTEEDTTDTRQITLASKMTEARIDFIVSHPEDDIVYMANSNGYFYSYNLNSKRFQEMELINDEYETTSDTDTEDSEQTTTQKYTITGMVFSDSSAGRNILMTTNTGEILITSPSSDSFSVHKLESTVYETLSSFSRIALTPNNEYAYLIDSANDVIWVYSIIAEEYKDQISSTSGLNPVTVDTDSNTSFSDLLVYEDTLGNIVSYVSGSQGLTLIDADAPAGASSTTKVIDANPSSGLDDEPFSLSGTPGTLAQSSTDTGYLYSVNGNASISVLTDNPWITIMSVEPESVTSTSPSFTVTFQTDSPGSFTVTANSDFLGTTGTELIAAQTVTAEATDTNITTETIDINSFSRATFVEGYNKVFIHLTDDNGNIGHAAGLLRVDRPPEPITITGVNFGNKRLYIVFEESIDNDIASYTLYARPAASQSNPSCPDSMTFDTADTVTDSMDASLCSDGTCEGEVRNLTNDVAYCLAVKVIDNGGQESALSSYTSPMRPELTVGPAGFLGETSCGLHHQPFTRTKVVNLFVLLFLFLFLIFRTTQARKNLTLFVFMFIFCYPVFSQAAEITPQHWTLEVKGTMMIPSNSDVKDFLGVCCNFTGEVEFGWLYKNRYNLTASVGAGYATGTAVGIRSGTASGDRFDLMLLPVRLDFIYRFDFKSNQLILPYLRAGVDTVLFRESTEGESITNLKFGAHGGAGIGILLDRAEQLSHDIETDIGINDIYLIIEGRYSMINSFKSTGLDLSGFYPYLGVLFEF